MTHKNSSYMISVLGVFGALIILQAYIPMIGYIRIFPMWPAISTIHLTVILGGVLLGVRGGAGLGLLWGAISLIKAYTGATDPMTLLLFQNPVIAILPRVAVGVVAALVFAAFTRRFQTRRGALIGMSLAGICGALTNTLLVIGFTWLFFASRATAVVPGANAQNLGWLLIIAFAINAVAESAMAAVVTPILGSVLGDVKRRRRR
ncbi:ECF transporter S component [Lacticaseibacillus kribbianus]|uniref:ECF transporter S component n=1 Tax=Lacticaseibacillus kribbianus TaxID=2926292 RepID=UPI001CD41220|nr:ECF transporter S component [Lacticaseibacillus kribbianus]